MLYFATHFCLNARLHGELACIDLTVPQHDFAKLTRALMFNLKTNLPELTKSRQDILMTTRRLLAMNEENELHPTEPEPMNGVVTQDQQTPAATARNAEPVVVE